MYVCMITVELPSTKHKTRPKNKPLQRTSPRLGGEQTCSAVIKRKQMEADENSGTNEIRHSLSSSSVGDMSRLQPRTPYIYLRVRGKRRQRGRGPPTPALAASKQPRSAPPSARVSRFRRSQRRLRVPPHHAHAIEARQASPAGARPC